MQKDTTQMSPFKAKYSRISEIKGKEFNLEKILGQKSIHQLTSNFYQQHSSGQNMHFSLVIVFLVLGNTTFDQDQDLCPNHLKTILRPPQDHSNTNLSQ